MHYIKSEITGYRVEVDVIRFDGIVKRIRFTTLNHKTRFSALKAFAKFYKGSFLDRALVDATMLTRDREVLVDWPN